MNLRTLIAVLIVAAVAGCSQRKAAPTPALPAKRPAPAPAPAPILPDGDPLLGPTTARPVR